MGDIKKLTEALLKARGRSINPWLPTDLASLAALCQRADRREGRITPPWQMSLGGPAAGPGTPLNEFMEQFTVAGQEKLLAKAQAHPIYKQLVKDVPRLETAPADSPFDPLRRAKVIADAMANPMPRKWINTSSRPDRQRAKELKAIRRLQQVTGSPERKRILTEWEAQDVRPLPVSFSKLAHVGVWFLTWHLWVDAGTADVQLVLQASQLIDPSGIDDATAGRYIKDAQKFSAPRPPPIRPTPTPPAGSPGLLGLAGMMASQDPDA